MRPYRFAFRRAFLFLLCWGASSVSYIGLRLTRTLCVTLFPVQYLVLHYPADKYPTRPSPETATQGARVGKILSSLCSCIRSCQLVFVSTPLNPSIPVSPSLPVIPVTTVPLFLYPAPVFCGLAFRFFFLPIATFFLFIVSTLSPRVGSHALCFNCIAPLQN